MHGTIFAELEKFVGETYGGSTWSDLKKGAGIQRERYDVMTDYPDSEVVALVTAASTMTGVAIPALLERFGEFIAPDLLDMYWGVIKPEWKTLDVIEHAEEEIHKVVRLDNPSAHPPYLHALRRGPTEVAVIYTSPRKLCSLAKRIARGIAKHYGETIRIENESCMLQGDANCTLSVRLASR